MPHFPFVLSTIRVFSVFQADMANPAVNNTQTVVGQLYDYYLWTLSLAGMFLVTDEVHSLGNPH